MYRESEAGNAKERKRYVLVERGQEEMREQPVRRQGLPVRRYSLARLGPSPRSALGVDRHERLERVAEQSPPNE